MKATSALIFTAFMALTTACFNAPEYNEVPEIEIVGIRSTNAIPNQGDSVILVISFKDGDGDLGKLNDKDTVPNFFLNDRRYNLIDSQSFSVPNIPQNGSVPDITGQIEINLLSKMFCNPLFPGKPLDTLVFDLRLRDRAGNFSNQVTTAPIILQCN